MRKALLGAVFLLALMLRLYKLDQVPPSLYWDEVSLGYNAYTISQTGRDEHGVFLPLTYFAAFGDYKPPAYVYAAVPFVRLFGPRELAVRLPSALAGTLLVLVTFFLVTELGFLRRTALLAALFVAVSPWAVQMSRAAFEANLATLFSGAGVLFFLIATRKRRIIPYCLSALLFALTFYTFNTHRIFVPILIGGLSLLSWRGLLRDRKKSIIFYLVLILVVSPLGPHMFSREGRLRFNEVTWLRNLDIIVESNKKIEEHGGGALANLIFNRRVLYVATFVGHYLDHFRPDFLFVKGDVNPRLSTQSVGEMYILDALFLLVGIVLLVRKRDKVVGVLFFWLLTAPIPAAFARETPHALRILNILPVPQAITALGLTWLVKNCRVIVLPAVVVVYTFLIGFYLRDYYYEYPTKYANSWQYGYKEVVSYVTSVEDRYEKISVTPKYGRPYIYFLFYGRVALDDYLFSRRAVKDDFGFWDVSGFGKYTFSEVVDRQKKWLYVRKAEDAVRIVNKKVINGLDGKPILAVTEEL